ncbi:MAG: hypothetical protein OXU36_15935 [Candidatus Poribacteria bacterium]|nr:hypothetical protein [Candidatus Poribacteria bacterium]
MAFSDFKRISEVQEKFRIKYTANNFFEVEAAGPSVQFLEEFQFTLENVNVFASEASRCEAIIFPILRQAYKAYADTYALWIRQPITYDETLSGTPDYLIATKSELGITVVGTPLIILVEAKKNDFEEGWGQCLAELVAAQKIKGDPDAPVYGIVSDGERWQFGKLVGDGFTQNRMNFSIDNLPTLFGAINAVFKAASQTESARSKG